MIVVVLSWYCLKSCQLLLIIMSNQTKISCYSWIWSEATAQMSLEEALGIGGFGYPAMAAVNARKMKYATLKGAFSEDGIHSFLR